jgi:hypothetical protein
MANGKKKKADDSDEDENESIYSKIAKGAGKVLDSAKSGVKGFMDKKSKEQADKAKKPEAGASINKSETEQLAQVDEPRVVDTGSSTPNRTKNWMKGSK